MNERTSLVTGRLFDGWTILILLGVGTFMVWGAGHYTVFDDEGFSCRRYSLPMVEMVSALWRGEEPDPPLYYVLQNVWVHLFGVGPLGLRSLSIIMFLAGLVFIRLAAIEWYDEKTGRLAMLIAAAHPAHLLLGFAGRWYSTMFLAVAILFFVTGRLSREPTSKRGTKFAWSLAAAAVCYTNYFGVVVVALLWIVSATRHADPRRWFMPAAGFLLIYAIWLPAFWHQATDFPQAALTIGHIGSAALRIFVALASGNLASWTAWWVWLFFLVFLSSLVLQIESIKGMRLRPGALGMVIFFCIIAGIVSRAITDKYIMTFSGPVCILLAAAWLPTRPAFDGSRTAWARRMAAISLSLAWLSCCVNLVTERHWSSQRWLDPNQRALDELADDPAAPAPTNWIISQPGARYYYGCRMARRVEPNGALRPEVWRRFAIPPTRDEASSEAAATPDSMVEKLQTSKPLRLATIRGAEYADAPDWNRLENALGPIYRKVGERSYLRDADAEWKDRLDPKFKHPKWRITVTQYELKGAK